MQSVIAGAAVVAWHDAQRACGAGGLPPLPGRAWQVVHGVRGACAAWLRVRP